MKILYLSDRWRPGSSSITLIVSGTIGRNSACSSSRRPLPQWFSGLPGWLTGRLVRWSVSYHTNCLCSALTPTPGGSDHAQDSSDPSLVPAEYHNLGAPFSKQLTLSFPHHRSYDCAIDLLPSLPHVCQGKVLPPVTCWTSQSPGDPTMPMVAQRGGLRHWLPSLCSSSGHPDLLLCGRPSPLHW